MRLHTDALGSLPLLLLAIGLSLDSLEVGESGRAEPPPAQSEAEQHLRTAEKAIQRRNFARAREELAKCIQLGLDNTNVRLLAARTARRAGDYRDAEKHLDAYQRLKGEAKIIALEKALARAQRGELSNVETAVDILKAPGLIRRAQEGKLSEQEKDLIFLADSMKKQPDAVLILEALTRGYLEAYCLRDALKCLDELLKRQPLDTQALFWRAWVYGHLRVYEHFPEDLRKDDWQINTSGCMDTAPIVPDLFEPISDKRAEISLRKQQVLEEYRRILKLDPELDAVRIRLAEELVGANDCPAALEQFQYLQRRHPKNATVLFGLARCRYLTGELEEAGKLLDRILVDKPRNAHVLRERGRMLLAEGKAAGAEEFLRQATTLAPMDHESLYLFYLCLMKLGKEGEAPKGQDKLKRLEANAKRFNEILRKIDESPRDAALRYEASIILIQNDRETEGIRWLQSALLMDPRHRPTHKALADYYQRVGKKELADKHREQAR